MRIGLANIVSLLSIYMFGAIPTMLIVIIRCLITFAFGGNLTGFLFSLAGGLLALVVMLLLRNWKAFSLFGVSMGGAAAHTVGQILIAAMLVRSFYVLTYLPVLLLVSIVTGLLIAALAIPVYKAIGMLRAGHLHDE
jgi:heptaprenyl diphosphate synthase